MILTIFSRCAGAEVLELDPDLAAVADLVWSTSRSRGLGDAPHPAACRKCQSGPRMAGADKIACCRGSKATSSRRAGRRPEAPDLSSPLRRKNTAPIGSVGKLSRRRCVGKNGKLAAAAVVGQRVQRGSRQELPPAAALLGPQRIRGRRPAPGGGRQPAQRRAAHTRAIGLGRENRGDHRREG